MELIVNFLLGLGFSFSVIMIVVGPALFVYEEQHNIKEVEH